jgi:hypothetical protein
MAVYKGGKLTRRAAEAVRSARTSAAGEGLWTTLTRKIGDDEPLAFASYGSWAFVLAYAVFRMCALRNSIAQGPTAMFEVTRMIAVVGLPLAVLGMTAAVIAFIRGEKRLWLAVGAFATSSLILIVSYLEASGKLVGILADKLPGI